MAFERIPSGYPGVDEVFDYIRMGDNVVWQVSGLDEYRLFAEAFARQAMKDDATLFTCTTRGMRVCSAPDRA